MSSVDDYWQLSMTIGNYQRLWSTIEDSLRSQPGSSAEQLFYCIKNFLGHTHFVYNIAQQMTSQSNRICLLVDFQTKLRPRMDVAWMLTTLTLAGSSVDYQRLSTTIDDYRWLTMTIDDYWWLLMTIDDYRWLSMTIDDCQRISMTIHNYQRLLTTINNYLWLLLTIDNYRRL